ncbi:MAG: class I SAM-dependent methyltransferase [Dehalococcoidia bacterium]|jgi:ubiquinone/menaquinone biosynthesis C-methylase UbiE
MKISSGLKLIVRGVQIIIHEGWQEFWNKYTAWRKQRNLSAAGSRSTLTIDGKKIPNPESSAYVGGGDFIAVGNALQAQLTKLCGLRPDEAVLDVGCGIGRVAVPLTQYLDNKGSYEGFDIVRHGIEWCMANISSKYPNFNFKWAGIYNRAYNPEGKIKAREFKFPYRDETFDLVFLTSVFTHMMPEDMEYYLSEISRVLKKRGRCMITFFLLNEVSEGMMKSGASTINFKYGNSVYKYENESVEESAIAYNEDYVSSSFSREKLYVREPVYHGNWCGRTDFPEYSNKNVSKSYQDIIIADKL